MASSAGRRGDKAERATVWRSAGCRHAPPDHPPQHVTDQPFILFELRDVSLKCSESTARSAVGWFRPGE